MGRRGLQKSSEIAEILKLGYMILIGNTGLRHLREAAVLRAMPHMRRVHVAPGEG